MAEEVVQESVAYEVADEVATITLNRPDLRNRMTVEMLQQAHALLERAATDDGACGRVDGRREHVLCRCRLGGCE